EIDVAALEVGARLRPGSRCPTLHGMEPSEEIRRALARWTKAIEAGNGAAFLGRLSGDAGTSMIGTDPAEFWIGGESRALWAQQMQETGGFPVTATEIHAWEEGTVGWAALK